MIIVVLALGLAILLVGCPKTPAPHCDVHEQLARCHSHDKMCRDILRICNREYAELKVRADVCLGFKKETTP